MLIVYLLLSFLAGVSIVLGRIINAQLAEKIGTKKSTLVNYITGLSLSFVVYLISRDTPVLSSVTRNAVPSWAYFGGLAGVAIIMSSNYVTPRLSAFYITLLIFIGQLFTGILIDYFILRELSIGKCIGGFLVFIGLTYNLWIDKKDSLHMQ